MDINNIPQTRINEIEQETVPQKQEKLKDTEFQAEKGRDLLGMQGDSIHVLVNGVNVNNQLQANKKTEQTQITENKSAVIQETRNDFPASSGSKGIINKYKAKLNVLKKVMTNNNLGILSKILLPLKVKTKEDSQTIIEIIKNPTYASKLNLQNIDTILNNNISNAKEIEAIMSLDIDNEKYQELKKQIGTENIQKLPDRIKELNKEFGIKGLCRSAHFVGDNNHIRVWDDKGNEYKLNAKTLELDAVINPPKVKNLKTGTEITFTDKTPNDVPFSHSKTNMEIAIKKDSGEIVDFYDISTVSGEYEMWRTESNGHKHLIGLAEISPNGKKHIEKNLTSLDGTKTNTVYSEDEKGNSFHFYQIKSADGEVLLETKKTRKTISENHYQTMEDGQGYDIEIKDDKVVITKLDNDNNKTEDSVVYSFIDMNSSDIGKVLSFDRRKKEFKSEKEFELKRKEYAESILGKNVISKDLRPAVSKLSGSEWFALAQNTSVIMPNNDEDSASSGAGFILLGTSLKDNLSVLEHELGHEKANYFDLYNNEEIKAIYEEEKELFTSSFPDEIIKQIDYFLEVPSAKEIRPLDETIAETNALLNTYQSLSRIQDRTVLLQQYFPKTIAKIAEVMKNNKALE